jgi:hypothetical protein
MEAPVKRKVAGHSTLMEHHGASGVHAGYDVAGGHSGRRGC